MFSGRREPLARAGELEVDEPRVAQLREHHLRRTLPGVVESWRSARVHPCQVGTSFSWSPSITRLVSAQPDPVVDRAYSTAPNGGVKR